MSRAFGRSGMDRTVPHGLHPGRRAAGLRAYVHSTPARVCESRALIWMAGRGFSGSPCASQRDGRFAGAVVLVVLSLYGIWAARRAALLEMQRLELEHLAHLGKMAAVLAHEIRNPWGRSKASPARRRENGCLCPPLLEPILSETGRLEGLVNDLLLYGRPPVPSVRMAKWDETLGPLRAHTNRSSELAISGSCLTAQGSSGKPTPHSSGGVAESHPQRGGRHRRRIRRRGEARNPQPRAERTHSVGHRQWPGMSDAARSRLFEPFFTTKASGTGLGLAITEGWFSHWAESFRSNPGKAEGTEASLRFPGLLPRKVEPA